jgi:chorismate-pyruvate lyase
MNPLDELQKLASYFPDGDQLFERVEHIPASTTPEPYKSLLVHEHHMTVTMEQFHHCDVNVTVLVEELHDPLYTREILLTKTGTHAVVLFGLVRFDFSYVTLAVKAEILAKQLPLGRVLIRHNVLRHIDLGAILQIIPGPALRRHLQLKDASPVYGRMATIFCNGRPAVDLLEVAAPVADG